MRAVSALTITAGSLAGCGGSTAVPQRPATSSATSPATSATASSADSIPQSGLFATVDSKWHCAVTKTAYPSQDAITADLDKRLGAVGLTHAGWVSWRAAVAESPALRAELTKASALPC